MMARKKKKKPYWIDNVFDVFIGRMMTQNAESTSHFLWHV